MYVVRDPALIKQLGVKDFDHFENHVGLDSDGIDVLFESGLFMLRGEKWRHMRGTLSPAFTGTKMRQMFQLVVDCADTTVAHFTQNAAKGQSLPVEIKDLFTRYSNDVIASCAFGIKVNSIEHPNNEFFESGSRLVNIFSFGNILKMFILSKYPIINRLFNVGILDKTVSKFFRSMVDETMETRRQHNIFRPDMVNILMQVRDGTLRRSNETGEELDDSFAAAKESHVGQAVVTRKWTDDELIAQCFLFFFAGFETASTVLSFAAYEMVVNPDVQQRLYEEIAANEAELNGERLTYENIQKMKYLDQVVSEILRKWSPLANIDRTCSKDYDFNHNGMKFTIEKGRVLLFPMYGLHHDAQYFPEPQRFDPDRFSDENRDKIVPGTYIPFGFGPRNCIGEFSKPILLGTSNAFVPTFLLACLLVCVFNICSIGLFFTRFSIWSHGSQSPFV